MNDAPRKIALRWRRGLAVTRGPLMDSPDYTRYIRADALTLADCMAVPEVRAMVEDRDRLKYVLEGVAGAIDTGRNEPLAVWREQIAICLTALRKLEGGAE